MEYVEERKKGLPHAGGAADNSITPLHCAAWVGDMDMAALILSDALASKAFNVHTKDDCAAGLSGELPIHYAARKGDSSMLRVLADHGADFAARAVRWKGEEEEPCGPTVLHFAVASGFPDAVQVVLDALAGRRGGEWFEESESGDVYSKSNYEQKVNPQYRTLYEIDCAVADASHTFGLTPLLLAVAMAVTEFRPKWFRRASRAEPGAEARREIVKKLLGLPELDPDISFGQPTALYLAVQAKDEKLVRLLLDRGASPTLAVRSKVENAITTEGAVRGGDGVCEFVPPLILARELGEAARKRGNTVEELKMERLVKLMLPFVRGDEGRYARGSGTALVWAIRHDDLWLTEELLAAEADPMGGIWYRPNAREKLASGERSQRYWSPLMYAVAGGNPFMVETIVEGLHTQFDEAADRLYTWRHRQPERPSVKFREKAQAMCERYQELQIMQMKNGDYGINYAERDGGLTALHVAARKGFREIVGLLLKEKVNVDCATKTADGKGGETPLHMALRALTGNPGKKSRLGLLGVVKLLLQAGADVNAEDAEGVTPRQLAAECSPEVRQQLGRACGVLLE